MNHRDIIISKEEMEQQEQYAEMVRSLPHRPQSYHVVTYGCQMNAHDSEKIAGMLEKMGYIETDDYKNADIVIFNTCCVRENAEERLFGKVGEIKNIKQNKITIIMPKMILLTINSTFRTTLLTFSIFSSIFDCHSGLFSSISARQTEIDSE